MSVVDMPNLAPALQSLVDARLDAVDRMLLGRISRQERLDVVGEVEGRIHELLRECLGAGGEPSREDVLAVLARLDPPEAYLPEDAMETKTTAPSRAPRTAREIAPPASAADSSRFTRFNAGLGIMSVAMVCMVPLGYVIALPFRSDMTLLVFWMIGWSFMFVGGLISVALAAVNRLADVRAVVGLVCGCVSLLLAMVTAIMFVAGGGI